MANKSFSTKGLTRQIEEKNDRLELDMETLQSRYNELEARFEAKCDEKELLHSRHEALSTQSQQLQHDLAASRAAVNDLKERRESATIRELRQENDDLQNLLDGQQDRQDGERRKEQEDLRLELEQTHNEARRHRQENEELKQNLDEVQAEIKHLQSESRDRGSPNALRRAERERAALSEKVQSLEDEVDVLQNELATKEDPQVRKLQAQMGRLQAQLDEALAELDGTKHSPNDDLLVRVAAAEDESRAAKTDKSNLQERLKQQQSLNRELESEVDSVRKQLRLVHQQLDDTFRQDQERRHESRAERRWEEERANLEDDLRQLQAELRDRRNVRSGQEKSEDVERLHAELRDGQAERANLAENLHQACTDKEKLRSRLEAQISELENELWGMKRKIAGLERRCQVVSESDELESNQKYRGKISQLEMRITELETVLKKARETDQKESVYWAERQLREQLESKAYEASEAERKYMKEISRLERQVRKATEDLEFAFAESQEMEKRHREFQLQAKDDMEISRATIERLEQRLHNSSDSTSTTHSERADLHRMLKNAKLEAEDLRLQMQRPVNGSSRELQEKLRRVGEERNLEILKSSALSLELEALQSRYQRAIDEIARQQRHWQEERDRDTERPRQDPVVRHLERQSDNVPGAGSRRAYESTGQRTSTYTEVRAKTAITPNATKRGAGAEDSLRFKLEVERVERRHANELKTWVAKAERLDAQMEREMGFKQALAYEKQYLVRQVELYKAW